MDAKFILLMLSIMHQSIPASKIMGIKIIGIKMNRALELYML